MHTFEQFLAASARHGGVNFMYEAGIYSLINDLELIIKALRDAGVTFEFVGGVAVNVNIWPPRFPPFVTRDIDLLIRREDLDRVVKAGESLGYRSKKIVGGYTLFQPKEFFEESVRLLFVGEFSKSTQPFPHPELHPEEKSFLDITIPVAPLKDVLRMTMTSFRPIDIVYLEFLDEAGLITPTLEAQLPPTLAERLKDARRQIEENKPDVY